LHQIDINEAVGKKAGDFMRTYSKSHNVTLADALIAEASELHHLKIWTLNKKHYPMITKENFVK
jgi:predicted nucleic acid-binding protein